MKYTFCLGYSRVILKYAVTAFQGTSLLSNCS
jgi:hypothetical protein